MQSRCTKFKFSGIPEQEAVQRMKEISRNEHANVPEDVLREIFKISGGDMRKSINLLQTVYLRFQREISVPTGEDQGHGQGMMIEGPQHGAELTLDMLYQLSGQLSPKQIYDIFEILLNSTFTECRNSRLMSDRRGHARE